MTSLERTVIDSIADFEKIGGLEELLRCLLLIPSLDYSKLLDALELYGRAQLYQKAGFILEAWKEELSLPEPFLWNVKNGLLPVKPISLKSRAILSFITDGNCLLQKI